VTLHSCGCKTRFNTVEWRSVALHRCAFHEAQEARSLPQGGSMATPPERSTSDDDLDEYVIRAEVMERLIRKFYFEVEYVPSERFVDSFNGRQAQYVREDPQISGCDTHGQQLLQPDEEKVSRQIMGMSVLRGHRD
jgi:hypothetical protein